jgi:hypothetical protein
MAKGAQVSTQLSLFRDERRPMVAGVRLGRPGPLGPAIIGGLIGGPIGLGLALPSPLLLAIGKVGAVAGIVGSFAYWMVTWRRFAAANTVAIGALGRGDHATARAAFTRWASSRNLVIRGVARHNLGWTLILEGRLEEAARLLEDTAEHLTRALVRAELLPTTRVDAALCHALLGDLDRAEVWCAAAQQPVKCAPGLSFHGMLALTRSILECRRGNAEVARVTIEHAWTEQEANMSGASLRLLRVMRAFACAAVEAPRNQGIVERLLVDLKPRYPGELAFLGNRWPEMATFLAAHELDG